MYKQVGADLDTVVLSKLRSYLQDRLRPSESYLSKQARYVSAAETLNMLKYIKRLVRPTCRLYVGGGSYFHEIIHYYTYMMSCTLTHMHCFIVLRYPMLR